jgi:RecB family endonuclease NucS
MNDRVALQKTNRGWDFINEWQLEDFVWNNMQEIFELDPLARQFSIKGESCDILAIRKNGQLVIIELKNVEDRYVINQLTRYYDNLLEEKPFQDKIDYHQEILLFAICPSFHRHNFIDRKYSKLRFDLFIFGVVNKNREFYFYLSQIYDLSHSYEESQIKKIKINHTETTYPNQANENIPVPPQLLLNWLGSLTLDERENILKIRYQILSFDERIEEVVINRNIFYVSKYGKDNLKMRYCAEFRFEQKFKKILFFLWLIIPSRSNKTIARMQIDARNEYTVFERYIPLKEGRISHEKFQKWTFPYRYYYRTGEEAHYIKSLVDEALQTWRGRLSR